MANVVIDIAAEFTGNKAFKKAETSTDKLSKSVKGLAGAFGLAFSATAVLAYGKAAVKAAAEDEKAQKQLALALKNVGLGRDAASSEAYIQKLQSEFGILDDKLRPAYQTLAVATRDTDEAQKLLNLSLDISASTGKDLGTVTSALSKAYLGNNTALSKLGVGISKADLKAGKFDDIINQLQTTFAGSATASANTFQGSMDKLAVASANVSEIIGTGLIDALKGLSDENSVNDLATAMESTALYIADVIRGVGVLIGQIKAAAEIAGKIPGLNKIMDLVLRTNPLYEPIKILNELGNKARETAAQTGVTAQALAHLAELQDTFTASTLGKKKKLTAEEIKALKAAQKALAAKKLANAIDKANLALGKGDDVFNMDKIQLNAALINQAEILGKTTDSAQKLQVANDVARLNVKQSILALEDAIAAKDEQAIIAATAKLNADLKVLGALTGQSIKLSDIKSILDSLKPADLINQANLDAALAKIKEMIDLLTKAQAQSKTPVPTSASLGSGIPVGDFIAPVSREIGIAGSTDALLEYSAAAQARANAFADLLDMDTKAKMQALQSSSIYSNSGALQSFRTSESAASNLNITVNAGVGDPEAIARAVEDVIRQSYQRGTSSTGLLAV